MMSLPIPRLDIVKECEGCKHIGKRVIGDKGLFCHRHPQPHTKWWYTFKCRDFIKKD